MRNRVLGLVTALTLAALLYGSASPAAACSCAAYTEEAAAREAMSRDGTVAAVASIDGFAAEGPDAHLVLRVEAVLLGEIEQGEMLIETTRDQVNRASRNGNVREIYDGGGSCGAHFVGKEGEPYLIVASLPESGGRFNPTKCVPNASLETLRTNTHYADGWGWLIEDALSADAEGQEYKNVPWIPIVILAFAVPLAALLIPSFFIKSKGSGH